MGQERVEREGGGGPSAAAGAGTGGGGGGGVETARALPLPFCSLVKLLVLDAALVPLVSSGMVASESVAATTGGGGSSSSFESVRSTTGVCEAMRAPFVVARRAGARPARRSICCGEVEEPGTAFPFAER